VTEPRGIPDDFSASDKPLAVEYIKAMLEYARDDARQVYLRVTAAVAVAALMLTQLPFTRLKGLETPPKAAFFVALAVLAIAAVLHHSYLQNIHHTRVKIAQCLPTADAATAQALGPMTWNDELWRLHWGDGLLAIAGVLVGWVIVALFT
jgi:hypothetical protein